MDTLNLGRVGFVNKGAWSVATAYKLNDVVTYNNGTYAALQAHTGQTPVAGGSAYWQEWITQDNSAFVADAINSATSKATPVDADELALVDSAASNALKKLTWANLKATLKTYFDTLYPSISGNPAFVATGASQSFTANVFTKLTPNSEQLDNTNAYDNATNYRFTPQTSSAKWYNVVVQMRSTSGNYGATVSLYKNGSEYIRLTGLVANAGDVVSGTVSVQLNGTTDYIEAYGMWTTNNTATTYFEAFPRLGV